MNQIKSPTPKKRPLMAGRPEAFLRGCNCYCLTAQEWTKGTHRPGCPLRAKEKQTNG